MSFKATSAARNYQCRLLGRWLPVPNECCWMDVAAHLFSMSIADGSFRITWPKHPCVPLF